MPARLPTLLALAVSLALAGPAAAADDAIDFDELKRRLDDAWEGLVDEVEPRIDRFSGMLDTLGRIDGLEHYEDPEILPNGDIIIRRREDAPPYDPTDLPEAEGDGVPI